MASPTEITPQQLEAKAFLERRGRELFGRGASGHGWQAALARAYNLSPRNVRYMLAAPPQQWNTVPQWVLEALAAGVLARRDIAVTGPTGRAAAPGASDEIRSADCMRALSDAVGRVLDAAAIAGWTEDEARRALVGLAIKAPWGAAGKDETADRDGEPRRA